MSQSIPYHGGHSTWKYIITHVFLPLQLPDGDDHNIVNDQALAGAITSAAHLYRNHLDEAKLSQWHTIVGMLDNLHVTAQFKSLDKSGFISQLSGMNVGDICAFLIRAQNAAIIFRKQRNVTILESFEVSPKAGGVMTSQGKLICSYPGPAIEIPTSVYDDDGFLTELVNFLIHMNQDVLDAAPKTQKAQAALLETRDTTHPRYVTELLTGILRSVGCPADISRISKRVGDDVVWNNSKLPWRRSSLWLLIRVALQTSLERSTLGHHAYKAFMLFFMCCLVEEGLCADLPNDLLHAMSAKISRRLRKLGSFAPDWLSHVAVEKCATLRSILEVRWREVRDSQRISPLWAPSQLNLAQDIQLSLLNSAEHLRKSLANQSTGSPSTHFHPEHSPRGDLDDLLSSDGAFFEEAYRTEPHVALYDVERTVGQDIDAWVSRITNNDEACVKLEILANKYSSNALKTYGSNPELLSIMFLTTIELWVALDKITIKETPMLADYSPEVPISLLQNLLLCKKGSLDRLRCAYQYLSRRHSSSKSGWSVFSSTATADSFSVRFYRRSSHLQCLKAQIEDAALDRALQKATEIETANARHAELRLMAAEADHEFTVNQRTGVERHKKRRCSKCRYEDELQKMQIDVQEWPLPTQQLQAEAVVFELDCPISFNMWRAATFHLLVDLCTPSVESKAPYIQLHEYTALRPYFVQHPRSRITLASDTKPFAVTHYSKISIPTTQERVCVNNGLTFYGFDSHTGIPISEALGRVDISRYCTYQLQSGSYHNLQKYVDATSHTSNEVVANQALCHEDLSIHEFIAFGHLRSGGLLQWLNILRELRGRSLSFHHDEVHFLLAQAVSQVGPLLNTEWTWHQEIQQPSFCFALLDELERLLRDVEANWLEVATMDNISFLLRRLLASISDDAISRKAIQLLRTTRSKVFSWTRELSDKLTKTPADEELRGLLRDAAVVCRSTFDVDPPIIPKLLRTAEDIEALLSCAILIHHHTPANVSSLPIYSQLLLDRNRRLSLSLEHIVRDAIQVDPIRQGFNLAIGWVWPDYRPDSKWTPLQNPNSRWLSCRAAATANQGSQVVHLNLLDGTLLVGGRSFGRLPSEIQRHPLYDFIFGKQVLEVVPGDLPGMDYLVRGRISDHQVYFSLRDKDLVIRATAMGSLDTIELVPPETLKGDLPAALVEGHAHWLYLSSSIVEVRSADSLWKTSPGNWRIDCTHGRYRVYRGHEFLVETESESWSMVSSLFKPLDTPQNLIVTASQADSNLPSSPLQLSVILPRYGLSFYVDEDGDLQSHNIRGMVYDENQSVRALFGLVNQLVLRPKRRNDIYTDELISRCVLIPEGEVSFRADGNHVRVEIDTGGPTERRITYQTYRINTDLGCLAGNGGLTNRLFSAYLHALTSGCGTDPLTGRSGTEEALSLLQSASCWSIVRFSSRDAELLRLIASICPSRTWYPQHLRRMQIVEWLDLPVKSQYHGLYLVCKGIKEHYERVQLFQEGQSSTLFQDFPIYDEHLLERYARRAAYLFPSDLSAHPSRSNVDVRYNSRDLVEAGLGEHRAYIAATVVYRRTANSAINKNALLKLLNSWTEITSGNAALSLQYSRAWLEPDLPLIWLKAYDLLRRSDESKWFQLLFSLPAMAYASPTLGDLVPVLVAFAINSQFRSENPPSYDNYNLSNGYQPSTATLRSYVFDCVRSFTRSPESSEPAKAGESPQDWQQRQFKRYQDRRNTDANAMAKKWSKAWPCATPPACPLSPDLYDVAKLTFDVQSLFTSCHQNLKLKEHFTRVQKILNNVYAKLSPIPTPRYSLDASQTVSCYDPWSLTLDELFVRPAPSLPAHDQLPRSTIGVRNTAFSGLSPLQQLICRVGETAEDAFQGRYISALRTSADYYGSELSLGTQGALKLPTAGTLEVHYMQCSSSYIEGFEHLRQYLGPRNESERALEYSGQWPRITPHTLFRCLASNSSLVLFDDWKMCLTRLVLLALELQRARRLLRLHLDNLPEELRKELENEGCDGWDPEMHPDWLLIQLQGDFLVRRVQADVANEMITPGSGTNTAMQLNMGEGKSSVIIPIVSVDLANGDQLVRVVVPKALTAQMFRVLVDRLGGLVNRRIYFVPFSRSLDVNHQKVAVLHEIMSECMKERGILVVQPEHVLSLRLVSVEKQLPNEKDPQLPELFLNLQRWLHSHSRDILDESDEILHARYQLVYTIGLQEQMEGFPERWTTTEQVLSLVKKRAAPLRKLFPLGVEYERGLSGSFPRLRILRTDAGQQLVSWIVQDVIDGLLPDFSFGQLSSGARDAIRAFISCKHVPLEDLRSVQNYCQDTPLWSGLLLLRGLFATGILLYAFKERRWRVDYGLAPTRTMLAVPYRAKDVPAQRAECGHPDVAIVLTCLSYYYGGLSEEQLRLSFENLLKQDDPTLDYDLWVRDRPDVPASLQTLSGVNTKSLDQWNTFLFPLFSQNKATVDFYLSSVVFPKEAKEFPSKLSCSGWDLAEKKERLVTGFSGTNDGQYLLPLHITQHDPDHQRGTNAKVLSYLLQRENNHYMCMTRENGERRTTHEFLRMLVAQKPEIRVLLDVGAQMLDLQNDELAKAWLDINPDVSATIYFNEDDELTVRTRDGSTQLFLSSPFAQQLDRCVIYLDDAHTRGTDIKFPTGFRAAVTLGPKVTKDRLTQGCMRMRNLGHGHSIMFFAPLEVDRRIRAVAGKSKNPLDVIETKDILHWTIRETCEEVQQQVPHWAQQGIDHTSRYSAWTSFCRGELSPEALSNRWLRQEAKRLEDLYGPHNTSNTTLLAVPDIQQRCVELGALSLRDVSMDEEQEREVIHEVERERHVDRPPKAVPAVHSIHPDVLTFVTTGVVPTNTDAFRPVFETLDATSAVTDEAYVWSPFVLATTDFEKTVDSSGKLDEYLRPVQWVVSGKRDDNQALVILSPYEVNQLIPRIRSSKHAHLHLYTPRVTRFMKPCDDLALYSIPMVPTGWMSPSWLMDQLNLFAGQLYLKDHATYIWLCRFLCVCMRDLQGEGMDMGSEGLILRKTQPMRSWTMVDMFQSPLMTSLRTLINLRRKGMRFAPTHMGKLFDGRLLYEGDFDDSGHANERCCCSVCHRAFKACIDGRVGFKPDSDGAEEHCRCSVCQRAKLARKQWVQD